MANANTLEGLNIINSSNPVIDEASLALPNSLIGSLPWFRASNNDHHKVSVITKYDSGGPRGLNEPRNVTDADVVERMIQLRGLDSTITRDVLWFDGQTEESISRFILGAVKTTLVNCNKPYLQSILDQCAAVGGAGASYAGAGDAAGAFSAVFLALGDGQIAGRVGWHEQTEQYLSVEKGSPYTTADNKSVKDISIRGWMLPVVENRFAVATATGIAGTDDALFEAWGAVPYGARAFMNACVVSRGFLNALRRSRTATTPTGAPAPLPAIWDTGMQPLTLIELDIVDTTTTTTTAAA